MSCRLERTTLGKSRLLMRACSLNASGLVSVPLQRKAKTGEVSVHEGARGVMRNSSHGCPDGCANIYAYKDRSIGERKEEGDSENQLRPGQLQSRFSQLIEEQAKASTFKKRTAHDGLEVLTRAKKKQVQKAAGKAKAKAKTKAKGKAKASGKTRHRPVQVLKPQAANRVKEMRSSRLVLAGWQDVKTRATSTHNDDASISVKDTHRIYDKLEQRLSASMITIYTDEDVAGVKNVDQESVREAHQMIAELAGEG